MSWSVLFIIAAGTYGAKVIGAFVGKRGDNNSQLQLGLGLLPPALLTALILVWTFDGGERLVLDARFVGVGLGAIAAWKKAPFVVVVLLAAAATAGARALA
jgi:hypothetical protein